MGMVNGTSILETARTNFDQAARLLDEEVPADILAKIRNPKERIELSIGPQMKDGHPDFTLPTLAGLIVEYAGMPDVPAYVAGLRHKRAVYAANKMPVVFLYPRDLQEPEWPERVIEQIAAAYWLESGSTAIPTHRQTQPPLRSGSSFVPAAGRQ